MGIPTTLAHFRTLEFLKPTGPLQATAAGTCSSLATLSNPVAMAGERLRLPNGVHRFAFSLGAQLNKGETALMLTGVLPFTAQAAGVDFILVEALIILFVGLILSDGLGGVPGRGAVIP